MERVWQEQGEAEAEALVEAMDASDSLVRIRVVYLDAEPGEPFAPEAPRRAIESMRGVFTCPPPRPRPRSTSDWRSLRAAPR